MICTIDLEFELRCVFFYKILGQSKFYLFTWTHKIYFLEDECPIIQKNSEPNKLINFSAMKNAIED